MQFYIYIIVAINLNSVYNNMKWHSIFKHEMYFFQMTMVNSLVKLEKKAEEKEEYIKLLKERLGNQKVPDHQEEEEDEEDEEDGQESMDHENEGTLCIFLQSKTLQENYLLKIRNAAFINL